MSTTLERSGTVQETAARTTAPSGAPADWIAATLAVGGAVWAVIAAAGGHSSARILASSLVAVWALTAVHLARRGEPNAALVGFATVLGGAGVASKDIAPVAAALLPAAALHLLLAIPTGALKTMARKTLAVIGYVAG